MRLIRYGNKGADVELTQLALERAGYDVGGVDGKFGMKTLKAVMRFQAAQGLSADGMRRTKSFGAIPFSGSLKNTARRWN